MKKLELKHLSQLAANRYQAHVMGEWVDGTETSDNPMPKTFTVVGFYLDANNDIMVQLDFNGEKEECYISDLFPLCNPLSYLTKEIEHDGEMFVPIEIIGEMLGYKLTKYEVDGEVEYGWDQRPIEDSQGYAFGWYEKGGCFAIWYDYIDGNPIDTVLDLNALSKLYEWHFDVFGLIPAGIAIDKNKLNERYNIS